MLDKTGEKIQRALDKTRHDVKVLSAVFNGQNIDVEIADRENLSDAEFDKVYEVVKQAVSPFGLGDVFGIG